MLRHAGPHNARLSLMLVSFLVNVIVVVAVEVLVTAALTLSIISL